MCGNALHFMNKQHRFFHIIVPPVRVLVLVLRTQGIVGEYDLLFYYDHCSLVADDLREQRLSHLLHDNLHM